MRNPKTLLFALAALLGAFAFQPALALFVGISGSVGDLDGDGDSSHEDRIVQSAAVCWSTRIGGDRSFVFTVWGEALSGGAIAQGWVTELSDDIPTKGSLKLDNDGSHVYYVDPIPSDSAEWTVHDPASPWTLTGGPTDIDLYSVVLHEMGHALGWLCGADSCGFDNPSYDAIMSPQPGDFTSGPACVAPFPLLGQAALPGCVHLQSGAFDVSLRGDGLGDSVNQLSHVGRSGDLMLGSYDTGADPRETMSPDDVALFSTIYGDPVNLPPTANAGPDLVSECNATGGSNVALDGTGSADPQGEALAYAWRCPGIALANGAEAVATGFFPLGSDLTCRLDVGDAASCPPIADFKQVRVVDTTAPWVACPGDAVVECTGNNGIEAADPQLGPFFSGFQATDVCDATLVLANDAPPFFPLGDTAVAFSATDDSSNASSCSADVTVQDTIRPTIAFTLDRTKLWPPNHKLVTIRATVTVDDVCDPAPSFVLTSIASSEPDDGLGDGDTAGDVQGAALGTPDTEFQLRSERSGTGPGRTYTVVYTVSDGSGNTSQASAMVFVGHDQAGTAKAGSGFTLNGADLLPKAKTFDLVVPTLPWLDARRVAVETAEVGNSKGVLPRVKSRLADVNGDGLADLIVTFSVEEANRLRAASGPDEPLALRWETAGGAGYVVPDIFALGAPVRYR